MPSISPSLSYAGEDRRATSKDELRGFYAYSWAAEVFVVCGMGSFIPVTLEQLARENGVLLSDLTTPCTAAQDGQCVVRILGADINTASFAMYTFSLSVLAQALLIISISGAADHGRARKMFLLAFALTGSMATMLFLPIVPSLYLVAAVLAIVANTCFGASFVLLNSFLPLLVRFHPTVQHGRMAHQAAHATTTPLLLTTNNNSNNTTLAGLAAARSKNSTPSSPELTLSTAISSYGIAIGYLAALLVQTMAILVLVALGSSTWSLTLVLFLIGAWWFLFTLPAARWLRSRPGPPLRVPGQASNVRLAWAYFAHSWKSLGRTLIHVQHLKDVLLFLAAWFLLSDGMATVSNTAVLFAKTTLAMRPAMLALINVIATLAGVLGAFLWSPISSFFRLTPIQTILVCIALFELIPIYGLLGFVPAIQRLGYLGLQNEWEMYLLGALYGFVLGGLSSYCRALFGQLIPPGYEAAFYALYAITDKGSSVFGPAVVAAITDAYGQIRPAFWFLALLVGLPFPIIMLVDLDRGRAHAHALTNTLENLSRKRGWEAQDGIDDDDDDVVESEDAPPILDDPSSSSSSPLLPPSRLL